MLAALVAAAAAAASAHAIYSCTWLLHCMYHVTLDFRRSSQFALPAPLPRFRPLSAPLCSCPALAFLLLCRQPVCFAFLCDFSNLDSGTTCNQVVVRRRRRENLWLAPY